MAPMRVPCAPTMTYRKTPLYFECFPYVCPEPVLVKGWHYSSHFCIVLKWCAQMAISYRGGEIVVDHLRLRNQRRKNASV